MEQDQKNKLIKILNHFGKGLIESREACDEFSIEFNQKDKKYYLCIYIYNESYDKEICDVRKSIANKDLKIKESNLKNNIFYVRTEIDYGFTNNLYDVLSELHFPNSNLEDQAEVIFLKKSTKVSNKKLNNIINNIKRFFSFSRKKRNTQIHIPAAGYPLTSEINDNSGTLGGTFYDNNKKKKYIVTNAHVIGSKDEIKLGLKVFSTNIDPIGKLVWCEYLNHDIALVELFKNNSVSDSFKFDFGNYNRELSDNYNCKDTVRFCGYSSSKVAPSYGTIDSLHCYKRKIKGQSGTLSNCTRIKSDDVEPGDSGSLIFDKEFKYIYGILFKGSTVGNTAYFKSIEILKQININLNI